MKRNKWLQNKKKDSRYCSKCSKTYLASKCKECDKKELCSECIAIANHEEILSNAVGKDRMKETFDPNRRANIEANLPGYLPSPRTASTRNSSWPTTAGPRHITISG
jgi:hypothetical protein